MAAPEQRLVFESTLNSILDDRLAALVRDTGWRDISSHLTNGWTGKVLARRINQMVQLEFRVSGVDATGIGIIALPVPLAPSLPSAAGILHRFALDPTTSGDDPTTGEVVWVGISGVTPAVEEMPRTATVSGSTVYMTTQPWSTAVIGTTP